MNLQAEPSAAQPRGEQHMKEARTGTVACFDAQSRSDRFRNYESHRVVRAAKITTIWGSNCVGIEPDGLSFTFSPTGKPTPQPGWYVVCYEDGYVSFCPPDQFENGYSASKNETKPERLAPAEERRVSAVMALTANYGAPRSSALHPSTYEFLKPTEEQIAKMAIVRAAAKAFNDVIDAELPDGPDKTFMVRAHRSNAMWANVAITRQADGTPRE